MNTVKLYGGLAEAYGDKFELDVLTPREMFRALYVQLDGFIEHLRDTEYLVCREMPDGNFALDEHLLEIRMSNTTFHLVPIVEGSAKKGVGKMILGAVMVGASFFIPGSTMVLGMSLKTMGIMTGLGLLLGGAAMMLAPTPKLDNAGEDDSSFLFSGDVAAAAQGVAIPVTYGKDRVKPIPVATQIKTNEYHIPAGSQLNNGSNGVGGGGGFFEHIRVNEV